MPRLTVRSVSSYTSPLPAASPTHASRPDVAALTVTNRALTCHQLQRGSIGGSLSVDQTTANQKYIDEQLERFRQTRQNVPNPAEFSPVTTSDLDPIEETPRKPIPRKETDEFTPTILTSSPIASQTMSHHHTLHPTPMLTTKMNETKMWLTQSPKGLRCDRGLLLITETYNYTSVTSDSNKDNLDTGRWYSPVEVLTNTDRTIPSGLGIIRITRPIGQCPLGEFGATKSTVSSTAKFFLSKSHFRRKVSFTPVLPLYGAGASQPSPVQPCTFFETYENELTRLLEADIDMKTAISTARTLTQAEQNRSMATKDIQQGTTSPYPPSTLQRDDKIRRAQQEQAMQAFSSVAIFCDRQSSGLFDDWAVHLEATLYLGNLEEARKLRLMRRSCMGRPRKSSITSNWITPYSAVKERLLKLFHSTETKSQWSVEFNMRREPEENMRHYANRVRKAFYKAYPLEGKLDAATTASREQMMMDRFIEGLQHDLKPRLKHKAELAAMAIEEN
ncbi:hypothetical protein OUZ56_026101 [Daphnia magna]|uniref:Retrotransposon gag domain-containing protein n=1 Tax=Daphnia magna TaxID=35525 RepID=A0ABQ9ZKU9_9CRUS|nr:hypothetical protein OUZ56_026101 [Daphnia magna]